METASMRPETIVLPTAPEWPTTGPTSTTLLHRANIATRRKTRPRSPSALTDSPDLSRNASHTDESRTDGMQSPPKGPSTHKQTTKPIEEAEPGSSTAAHGSDRDIDHGTDATSGEELSAAESEAKQNVNVKKLLDNKRPPEAATFGRPIWISDDEASSDEDEDARIDYRRLLRKRSSEDTARVESAFEEMKRKRRKAAKEVHTSTQDVKLIAFASVDAARAVPVLVEAEELEEDLFRLFGDVKEADKDKLVARKPVPIGHGAKMGKRKPVTTGVPCSSKDFVKHAERKGWVVCVFCDTEVWPPNINKHKAACKARGT